MPKGEMPCTDHKGRAYPSVKAMLEAYGIPRSTYGNRLKRGWSQAQALETPTEGNAPKVKHQKPIQDHTGAWHNCVREMAERWGITEKVYWSRKRILGWPLEKILTTPIQDRSETANAVRVSDHLGDEFPSISAMCRHWKIKVNTYRERIKRGYTVERALTENMAGTNDMAPKACMDHLGNAYPSLNAMCRAYGVTRYCYQSRLGLGWSQEKALTSPHVSNAEPATDYHGRTFPSAADMANFHGLPKYAFQGRGMDGKDFPDMIKGWWEDRACGKYHVKRMLTFPWFLARTGGGDVIVHYESLLDEWHDTGMEPILPTAVSEKRLRVLKRIRFPWYLVEADGEQCVMGYWEMLRFHAATNFGLQPRPEKK